MLFVPPKWAIETFAAMLGVGMTLSQIGTNTVYCDQHSASSFKYERNVVGNPQDCVLIPRLCTERRKMFRLAQRVITVQPLPEF